MTLRLEKDGSIARILIDRVDKRNAFNQAMWEQFPELLADAMEDDAVRVLIVSSAARDTAFCAGADIREFATGSKDPEWRAKNQAAITRVQHELAHAAKPTIAVIDGDCVGGGCGIALACDIRFAGPDARFGITPAKLGLVYSLFDTKLLLDVVGPSQTKRILFTGQLMNAEEAARIGLITQLADDPYAEAQELAGSMTSVSPHSQQESKKIIRRILDGQTADDADTSALFAAAFDGPDFNEGVSAFLEKRKAEFAKS